MASGAFLFGLLFSFCLSSSAQEALNFTILSYRALQRDYYVFQNAYYAIEVCACSSSRSDPKLYPDVCTCQDLRGETIRRSIPSYQSGSLCERTPWHSSACLHATLRNSREISAVYVRFSANGIILNKGNWQKLVSNRQGIYSVTFYSTIDQYIELRYALHKHKKSLWSPDQTETVRRDVSQNTIDDDFETQQEFPMTTSTTTTTTPSTTTAVYYRSPPRTYQPYWATSTTTPRPTTTTTMQTTTTTRRTTPRWERRPAYNDYRSNRIDNRDDHLDFLHITNMWMLREALYKEAQKDHIDSWDMDTELFKREMVKFHNAVRALHGSPPLQRDYDLDDAADHWAGWLGHRGSCIVHDPVKRYGECLFAYGTNVVPNPRTFAGLVTQSFYMEKHIYNYNSYAFDHATGHFTQMIWKESRRIGVGVSVVYTPASSKPCGTFYPTYQVYVVIKYDPPGNVLSKYSFMENVQPDYYRR